MKAIRFAVLVVSALTLLWGGGASQLAAQTGPQIKYEAKAARTSKPARSRTKKPTKQKEKPKPSKARKSPKRTKPARPKNQEALPQPPIVAVPTTPQPSAPQIPNVTPATASACEATRVQCFKSLRDSSTLAAALSDAYNLEMDIADLDRSLPAECQIFQIGITTSNSTPHLFMPIPGQEISEDLLKRCEQEFARIDEEKEKLLKRSGVFQGIIALVQVLTPESGEQPTPEEEKALLEKIEDEVKALGLPLPEWRAYHERSLKCDTDYANCMKGKEDQVEL